MVGDGDDTIIASSYVFGATQFDLQGAWAAMDKGATRPGTTSDGHPVREQLDDYLALGYVPDDAAVTLEYCHDDFALAQFAEHVGDRQKSAKFLKRAQNWQNLFDPSTGYLRPRHANGAWLDNFSPASGDGFVEGTAAQYLWLVNFNFRTLVDKLGGNAKAVARLDRFFTKLNDGLNTEFAYLGNEPCEEAPWVYDFAAAPWRTQAVVRRIQTELFTSQPSGLPGNDDAGALSSWYVFSVLGLYPEIPGVAGFVVGSPLFPRASVCLANGNTLQINGAHASPSHPYVRRLQLNGQDRESPWIPWSDLSNGGVLEFDLAAKPSNWGNDPLKAPPSFNGN
jgi:predicted alpha-1,2-mannosidase